MITFRSEAMVLRTWPFHESDVLVSLFTREYGKVKGVAKAGAKSRKRFGGSLEPMTRVVASYTEKPKQDLVRLNAFEIVSSPLSQEVDYARMAALCLFAEALEGALPEHDPQDAIFRLTAAVVEQTRVGSPWLPVSYFSVWITRLMGWLPSFEACIVCGERFTEKGAYVQAMADGLFCTLHKPSGSAAVGGPSLLEAQRMLRAPIRELAQEAWPRSRAADLRRFALSTLERHLERKLISAVALARMGG